MRRALTQAQRSKVVVTRMANGIYVNGEHPLIRRVRNFASFSAEDDARLLLLVDEPPRMLAARRDLNREGERPRGVHLILSGWACSYKVLEDGRQHTRLLNCTC